MKCRSWLIQSVAAVSLIFTTSVNVLGIPCEGSEHFTIVYEHIEQLFIWEALDKARGVTNGTSYGEWSVEDGLGTGSENLQEAVETYFGEDADTVDAIMQLACDGAVEPDSTEEEEADDRGLQCDPPCVRTIETDDKDEGWEFIADADGVYLRCYIVYYAKAICTLPPGEDDSGGPDDPGGETPGDNTKPPPQEPTEEPGGGDDDSADTGCGGVPCLDPLTGLPIPGLSKGSPAPTPPSDLAK